MRWDRLFEDLEDQLASEWEAERRALDSEAERLRLSRLPLRDRLVALCDPAAVLVLETRDGVTTRGTAAAVGADFVAVRPDAAPRALEIHPLDAVLGVGTTHGDLLRSARPAATARSPLSDRVTLGFVLRDAARRRVPVRVRTAGGAILTGTVDRAGLDHLDLAVHDVEEPRRAGAVRSHRMVPFAAITCVRLDDVEDVRLP